MLLMKLSELKTILNQHPEAHLHFVLPDGASIPAHAHVTEVARIDKRFIDCGGTLRNESQCRLQTWFSDDTEHRLTAGKLVKILDKAGLVLGTDDLDVDIEHQAGYISQFPLQRAEILSNEIVLSLTERRTACLAEDKCKPAKEPQFNLLKFNPRDAQQSACCGNK
jgi:hypothetical protein